MKPDYKNWVPKGMVLSGYAGTAISAVLLILFACTDILNGKTKLIVSTILGLFLIGFVIFSCLTTHWYKAFSYNGKRQFAKQIIERTAEHITLPEGGKGLDIGCGSGALTIACAKNNPQGTMVGLDRWGKEYASFNKPLCESNAKIEGVAERTSFVRGDACKLDFPDETFDAVTSNYCYHNISGMNRQDILLETLRVLKKGGTFAIHDLFTKQKYGDMDKFINKLKSMGYERVELLDTTNGMFMTNAEAKSLSLSGSALLVGKK